MTDQQAITTVWQKMFNATPTPEFVGILAEYGINSESRQRLLFWLALRSRNLTFSTERDRCLWLLQRLSEHHSGGPIPSLPGAQRSAEEIEVEARAEAVKQTLEHWEAGPGDERACNATLNFLGAC